MDHDLFRLLQSNPLFAEQSYGGTYAIVILFVLLGACAVGVPRFRKTDPLAKPKKKRRKRR